MPPGGGGPEIVPVRQYNKNPQNWQVELWTRSLRKPGVLLQHPTFAAVSIGAKELHEQWGHVMPLSRRQWPFSGSTVPGRSGPEADAKSWIERPVATGKYALDHMGGTRYKWNMSPRPCPGGCMTKRRHPRQKAVLSTISAASDSSLSPTH